MKVVFIPSWCHGAKWASVLPSTRNTGPSFSISDFHMEISSCFDPAKNESEKDMAQ